MAADEAHQLPELSKLSQREAFTVWMCHPVYNLIHIVQLGRIPYLANAFDLGPSSLTLSNSTIRACASMAPSVRLKVELLNSNLEVWKLIALDWYAVT